MLFLEYDSNKLKHDMMTDIMSNKWNTEPEVVILRQLRSAS